MKDTFAISSPARAWPEQPEESRTWRSRQQANSQEHTGHRPHCLAIRLLVIGYASAFGPLWGFSASRRNRLTMFSNASSQSGYSFRQGISVD